MLMSAPGEKLSELPAGREQGGLGDTLELSALSASPPEPQNHRLHSCVVSFFFFVQRNPLYISYSGLKK